MTSNAKTIRVNQEERPLGIVQGMYKKLDKFTVEYVIDSIKQCTRKANNIRAVLLTVCLSGSYPSDVRSVIESNKIKKIQDSSWIYTDRTCGCLGYQSSDVSED